MEVKASVQLTVKQMYEFLMLHTYSTTSGLIGLVLSIGGYIGFFYMLQMEGANPMYIAMLFATGMLFTVVQPFMIYRNAKKQVKAYEEAPMEYTVSKRGIDVKQSEKTGFSSWDEITKVTSTKRLVMFYTSRVHAYVIPKEDIGDQMDTLKAVVKENCYAGFIKIK